MSDGGKGSAPRKQQDHEAYSSNYDVIFGGRKTKVKYERSEENRTGHRNDNGSQDDPRSGNEGH